MSKSLRPYQATLYKEISYCVAKHQRIIAQAVTGAGKTVIFTEIAKNAQAKGKTVLLITESTKIFPQIAEENAGAVEISAGVKTVGLEAGKIFVAMAQTLTRRPVFISWFNALKNGLVVIFDECHVGTGANLLKQLPDCLLIGFTATPDFRAAKHLPALYNEIVCSLQPSELVELGFLAPYTHWARTKADLSSLQKQGGEFTEESQMEAFEKKVVYEGLIEDIRTLKFRKAIIFTSSIKHCDSVWAKLTEEGFNAVPVHSETDANAINLFTKGDVDICVSVGMITKGFDYKPTDLIVLLRATTSLPLYLQMCGRGSRISEGKTGFTVLDYGDNWKRFGLWIHDRDWQSLWKGKPKNGEGVAPIKDCPSCGFIVPAMVMECPNCLHKFEARKEDLSINKTNLVDLTAEFNALRGRRISTLSPRELVAYVNTTNKKPFGLRIVKSKLQEGNEAFVREYAGLMNFKKGFLDYISAEVLYSDDVISYHDIVIR